MIQYEWGCVQSRQGSDFLIGLFYDYGLLW